MRSATWTSTRWQPGAGLTLTSPISHYSGGVRVARFDATGIEEVGRFIDQGGNDLRVVQLTDEFVNGRRVVAFSDRDYGFYLASYTGPWPPDRLPA